MGDAVFRTEPDDLDSPALEFDGDDDYVETPINPADLGSTIEFEIMIYIASGAGSDRMKIFSGFKDDGDTRWDFEYNRDEDDYKLWFNEWGGKGDQSGNKELEEERWYKVGFKWEAGDKVTLYIDDEVDGEFNIENNTLDDGANLRIAGRPDGSEKEWEGLMDSAKLWDNGTLLFDYPMNEGEGDTVYDNAGDNDGTIYGATWTTRSGWTFGTLTDVVAIDDGLELDLPAWNEIFADGQTWREVFE